MAINYKPVGWDTTKYVNPTNMNHMDEGIKAACDKADANEAAIADVNNNFGQLIKIVDGTLPDATGDYTIAYVIPDSYIPIKAYYFTDYNQWRNLNIGYYGSTLVITDSTSDNVNRPYRLVCLKK